MSVHIGELNDTQIKIMGIVSDWVHKRKIPTPYREIIKKMEKIGVKSFTTMLGLRVLLRKGYLRKSCIVSNKISFVQLRGI